MGIFPETIANNTLHLKKNVNIMKKVNNLSQKVKPKYYIYSLHRVNYSKPLFHDILMIMAYR